MKYTYVFVLFGCFQYIAYSRSVTEITQEMRFNFIDRSSKCGFDAEKHQVYTADGYILTVFHVKPKEGTKPAKFPIILQHGLFADANFWVVGNCGRSLPFLLSKAGNDVWVSNSRGTLYSQDHILKNVNTSDFWKFSWDEMAKYDVPAVLNYVLSKTGAEKVNYVGHSQGTEIMFAAPTLNRTLPDLVDNFFALAPVTKVTNVQGFFKVASYFIPSEFIFNLVFGYREFLPSAKIMSSIGGILCPELPAQVCGAPLFMISGNNPEQFDESMIGDVTSSVHSSTSAKNILHYYQGMYSDNFQYFSYGWYYNKGKYGQNETPKYDLSKVTMAVHLFAGTGDWLAPMENVNWLKDQLPNVVDMQVFENWTHLDIVLGKDAPQKIFSKIVSKVSE